MSLSDGLSHDRKTAMPALAVSIEAVTTVLLWMRIGSRFATAKNSLGLDDALIFAAWITGVGLTAAVLLGTEKYGLNRHIWDVPPEYFSKGGLMGFIVEVLFFWSTCFTKVSVLMFYRRLVEGTLSKKFRFAIWAAIVFVIAYTIAFFVVIVLTCDPVKAIWMAFDLKWRAENNFTCKAQATQVHIAKLIGALSVVTDFYSVALPAALVMQIRISRKQRIGLFFIFGLGMLVVGAGIARTYYLGRVFSETIDKTWWTWDVFLASIVECNVAIICACAPSVKALFGKHFKDAASRYTGRSKTSSQGKSYGTNSTASERGYISAEAIPATELQSPSTKSKVDSAYSKTPPPSSHIISMMRTHEHADDYQEDVSVAYRGSPELPRVQGVSPIPTSNLFNTPFPLPPGSSQGQQRKSFLMPPSPSISSEDEISLVNNSRYESVATETINSSARIEVRSPHYSTADDGRRMSARSISPSALLDESPQLDPLMPVVAARPAVVRDLSKERLQRTKFPVM